MPRWLGTCGEDGFSAYDAAQSRLTLFSATGKVHRTTPVSPIAGFNQLIACSPGSLFFLLGRSGVGAIAPGTRGVVKTVLVRIRESRVDTLSAAVSGQEFYVNRARSGFSEVPLGKQVLTASGTSRLFLCDNLEGRCVAFDTSGVQRASFAVAAKHYRVSADDWARARQLLIESEPLSESQNLRERVLQELPQPKLFPLIDEIQGDVGDRLWVRTFRGYESQFADWLILRATGELLARASLPRGLQILEVGEDYLLGLARDADGVESVGFYRFRLPIR